MYNVSEWCDSPDSASTRPCDLVGPLVGTDTCSSRFDSSATTRWVRVVNRPSGIDGRRCGWPRYVRRLAFALSVLTRLVFSQRCRTDSFRVAACAAHCAALTTWFPIHLIAFAITPALQIVLDVSQSISLTSMA